MTAAEAKAEIAADFTELIFADENTLRTFAEANSKTLDGRNLLQRLADAIRRFIARLGKMDESVLPGMNITREQLLKAEQLYREVLAEGVANKSAPAQSGKAMMALGSKTQPGRLDPRTVTKADVKDMLEKAEQNIIYGDTYIPVRINTPSKLIYWAKKENNDTIDNKPIAMSADKAYKAMTRDGETGTGRLNRLTPDEIILMIEAMDDPQYIVYQAANDRYVEVVQFTTGKGNSAFAIIEIGNHKNPGHMNGYEGGLYNILVTTYPPKTNKLKELLNNPTNKVIYDKKKDASQRSSSSIVPSLLNDASFYEENISQPEASVKSMMSLKKRDTDYADAVKRGDMETAQKMVDEAAEAAMKRSKIRDEDGNLIKVYHGSDSNFTVFDRTKGRSSMDIQGMFFSPWDIDAAGYGSNVRAFYLDIRNPAPEQTAYRALRRHQQENYAGVKAREDLERMKYDGVNNENEEYIAFNPAQIKSADPVTYDDNGNVIPLSERFNPKQSDIRYSTKGGGLDALRKQYGEIEPGENPVRQAHVPRKTEKNKNVSQTVRTIIEAGATPGTVLPDVEQLIKSGDFYWEVYSYEVKYPKTAFRRRLFYIFYGISYTSLCSYSSSRVISSSSFSSKSSPNLT